MEEPSPQIQTFAEQLQQIRSITGFSVPKLAKKAGVSESSIQNYLKGRTLPPSDRQKQIIDAILEPAKPEKEIDDVALKDHAGNEAPAYLTAGDSPGEDAVALQAPEKSASVPSYGPIALLSFANPAHQRFSA